MKIGKLGYDDIIIPFRGFFKNTLPLIRSDFCLSFIDCDLCKSIDNCAETVWQNTVSNGIIIFDDIDLITLEGSEDQWTISLLDTLKKLRIMV